VAVFVCECITSFFVFVCQCVSSDTNCAVL
jgi:hypothetical protein